MGLSGSSTKKTYTPSPQQTQAASTLTSAYQANQPYINQITGTLRDAIPGLASALGSTTQGVGQASSYYNNVLGGKYLDAGNPYLSGQITATDNAIQDRVNGAFSAAGRTGSGANVYALTKALGENENALRYQDYTTERQRMADAASGASTLNAQTLGSLLGLSTTAVGLPLQQAAQYAGGIGSLGIGGTTTRTDNPSLASSIGQGLQLGQLFLSDRRLKVRVRKLGEYADGLGRYAWRYIWGGDEQQGVMADEVAALRPWALGPMVAGYATVNYEAL